MKYEILGFNQEEVVKLSAKKEVKKKGGIVYIDVKVDVTDLLILSDIADFMNRKSIQKTIINDKIYSWVKYSQIITDLPILDIKEQAFADRLDKLVLFGLLEKEIQKTKFGSFTYFRIGDKYERIKYKTQYEPKSSEIQEGTSSQVRVRTCSELQTKDYNTNNNSLTNNTNKEKEDKSSSKKDDYLPFAAEPQQEYGKVVEKKEWREDFTAYLNLVNQAKRDLLSDSEYKAYIEKYYPNADYENSVGKLVDGFWGTEEGWDYCKMKRKGKTINMLSTLKKNLDARSRIVYKPLQNTRQKPLFNSTKSAVKVRLNPNIHLVDNDGKLSDGTFLKSDGLRYYFSYIDKKTYSIPLDAEPMPQSEKVAYDYKNGWYECE